MKWAIQCNKYTLQATDYDIKDQSSSRDQRSLLRVSGMRHQLWRVGLMMVHGVVRRVREAAWRERGRMRAHALVEVVVESLRHLSRQPVRLLEREDGLEELLLVVSAIVASSRLQPNRHRVLVRGDGMPTEVYHERVHVREHRQRQLQHRRREQLEGVEHWLRAIGGFSNDSHQSQHLREAGWVGVHDGRQV
ncbi:hypothetical protein PMAYCL1PPCAC_11018, partial [Pristionchus mayeri]